MKRTIFLLLIGCVCLAEIPHLTNYQGKLTNPDGVAITGVHAVEFAIYDDETAGTLLWSETHPAVTISHGLFDVLLGSVTPIDLPFDEEYWIELTVDSELMTPRQLLTPVSYAFRSVYADTAEFAFTAIDSGSVILNQDTIAQEANYAISGIGESAIIHLNPMSPDTFTAEAGMMRTVYDGSVFRAYIHDGVCWRLWFPYIDTINCHGGPVSVSLDCGEDTTMCSGLTLSLNAVVSNGFSPLEFDWSIDGTGDWDDSEDCSFIVNDDTTVVTVSVRDLTGAVTSDSITVKGIFCCADCWVETTGVAISGTFERFGIKNDYGFVFGKEGFIIEFNSEGNVITANDFSSFGQSQSIIEGADGGYLSYSAGDYTYLYKVDSLWNFVFEKEYEFPPASDYSFGSTNNHFTKSTSGAYFLVSRIDSSFSMSVWKCLMKTNSSGNLILNKGIQLISEPGTAYSVSAITNTEDTGVLITGSVTSCDIEDPNDYSYIVCFDSLLGVEWTKKLTIPGWGFDLATAIRYSDGGYLITGIADSISEPADIILTRLTSTGDIIWSNRIEEWHSWGDYSLAQALDGGIFLSSRGRGGGGSVIMKFTNSGELQWSSKFSLTSELFSLRPLLDYGVIAVGGKTYDKLVIARFDSLGNNCLSDFINVEVEDVLINVSTISLEERVFTLIQEDGTFSVTDTNVLFYNACP